MDVLERIFLGPAALPPQLRLDAGAAPLSLAMVDGGGRGAALEALNRHAWPLDAPARAALLDQVLAWSGAAAPARPSHRVLLGEEVRRLAERPGHTIGGHSVHHLALTTMPLRSSETRFRVTQGGVERAGQPAPLRNLDGDVDAELRTVMSGRLPCGGYRRGRSGHRRQQPPSVAPVRDNAA